MKYELDIDKTPYEEVCSVDLRKIPTNPREVIWHFDGNEEVTYLDEWFEYLFDHPKVIEAVRYTNELWEEEDRKYLSGSTELLLNLMGMWLRHEQQDLSLYQEIAQGATAPFKLGPMNRNQSELDGTERMEVSSFYSDPKPWTDLVDTYLSHKLPR